jgi:hypothetical protein
MRLKTFDKVIQYIRDNTNDDVVIDVDATDCGIELTVYESKLDREMLIHYYDEVRDVHQHDPIITINSKYNYTTVIL